MWDPRSRTFLNFSLHYLWRTKFSSREGPRGMSIMNIHIELFMFINNLFILILIHIDPFVVGDYFILSLAPKFMDNLVQFTI